MFKFRCTCGWFCEGVTIISFSAFDNVAESDDFWVMCGVSTTLQMMRFYKLRRPLVTMNCSCVQFENLLSMTSQMFCSTATMNWDSYQ